MQNNILFDNIYIGHSVEDADALRLETFVPKVAAEKAEEEATRPKPEDPIKSTSDLKFLEDPVPYVQEKVKLFTEVFKRDGPVEAVKFVPEVAGAAGAVLAVLISLIFVVVGGGAAAPSKEQVKAQSKKAKDAAVEAKDKAAAAVATGAEKAQAEVNKRTTRSNAS